MLLGQQFLTKDQFLEALGLVTKEASIKLQSKSNERKRRKTANPSYTHEAIQAKQMSRAMHLAVIKRSSERVQKQVSLLKKTNINHSNSNNNNNNNDNIINNNQTSNTCSNNSISIQNANITNIAVYSTKHKTKPTSTNSNLLANATTQTNNHLSQRYSSNSTASSLSSSSSTHHNHYNKKLQLKTSQECQKEQDLILERENMFEKLLLLRKDLIAKEEANKRLIQENENIRKLGLDIVSIINLFSRSTSEVSQNCSNIGAIGVGGPGGGTIGNHGQQQANEPLDIWIDMKCEESLDGLD